MFSQQNHLAWQGYTTALYKWKGREIPFLAWTTFKMLLQVSDNRSQISTVKHLCFDSICFKIKIKWMFFTSCVFLVVGDTPWIWSVNCQSRDFAFNKFVWIYSKATSDFFFFLSKLPQHEINALEQIYTYTFFFCKTLENFGKQCALYSKWQKSFLLCF